MPLHLLKSEEGDESWRGHGCGVPLQGQAKDAVGSSAGGYAVCQG